MAKSTKRIKKLKTTPLSRSFSVAKMTLGAAAGYAFQGLRKSLSSDRDQIWKNFLEGRAAKLALDLGELKGSLMKAGQMLSMMGEHFLPPEANKLLKSLQSDSPFVEWPEMEKRLRRQWSQELWDQVIVDPEPIAAASLGQVHRAILRKTGEELVVKIQYPGVSKAIDADLKALKTLLSLAQLLPKEIQTEHIFAEVKTMLRQEADYEQELKLMETYRGLLGADPRYIIPKAYPEFCTKKILVFSYEAGVRADSEAVMKLSQERRNALARNFLALYFRELFEWGFVQTDPHLGNYQIRLGKRAEDDKIILFDFGATRRYGDDFLQPYRRMLRAAFYNDEDALIEAAYDLKFLLPQDNPGLKQAFRDFCYATMEPFLDPRDPRIAPGLMNRGGDYDWKNTDLPSRLSKQVYQLIRAYGTRTPPSEVLFLDRKTGGVFVFLSVLGARFPARSLIVPYLEALKQQ